MTKKEIVKTISEEIGLTQLKTKEIVQKTFDAIIQTLVDDPSHRIELRNFGVFEVKKRAARKARNPRTGERVDVAEKYVVTFKPGKEMEEQVRRLEREAARSAQQAAAGQGSPGQPSPAQNQASPAYQPGQHEAGGHNASGTGGGAPAAQQPGTQSTQNTGYPQTYAQGSAE